MLLCKHMFATLFKKVTQTTMFVTFYCLEMTPLNRKKTLITLFLCVKLSLYSDQITLIHSLITT